jgi:hypothetical protein
MVESRLSGLQTRILVLLARLSPPWTLVGGAAPKNDSELFFARISLGFITSSNNAELVTGQSAFAGRTVSKLLKTFHLNS